MRTSHFSRLLACTGAVLWAACTSPSTFAQALPPSPTPSPIDSPTRVAILHFGPPPEWKGAVGDLLGLQIDVTTWRQACDLLEKERAQVVIVQVHSSGGSLLAMEAFHKLFQEQFKPRFRTIAWVDSAAGPAALALLPIEEMCFRPEGSLGPAGSFFGMTARLPEMTLERQLTLTSAAAEQGKRSPKVSRAMQVGEPLSVDVSDTGAVDWRQDELGQFVLSGRGMGFCLSAKDAVRFGFAFGTASSREEVVEVLGLCKVEWAGKAASELIDSSLRDRDAQFKSLLADWQKYELKVRVADQTSIADARNTLATEASTLLSRMEAVCKAAPDMRRAVGLPDDWFHTERTRLTKLLGGANQTIQTPPAQATPARGN